MNKLNLRDTVKILRQKLDNGLDVVLIPKNDTAVVSINMAYKAGSKDEQRGRTGMAHLLEHLMFEGSKNVPKGDFDKLCSLAGGTNNAYTTYDYTAYTMTLPSHQLELGLWLEADRLKNPDISPEALLTQQKVVSEEIRQTVFDSPYGRWRELLAESAFSSRCSYSWEVHGRIKDVESVTLNDLEEFSDSFYHTANACLVICGKFDISNAEMLVAKYFNNIKNGKKTARNEFKSEYRKGNKHRTFHDAVHLPAVFLSFHCPGFTDEKIHAADIIANILANGRSSRLYNSLVHKKQIASEVGGYVDKREYSSFITFYAVASQPGTSPDELAEAIVKEIELIKINSVKNSELTKTINQITSQVAHEMLYSAGIADIAANQALFWDDPERFYNILDKYKRVKIKDITETAHTIFNPKNLVRVDALPKK